MESKKFWKSKTFLGITVMVASVFAKHYNVEIPMVDPSLTEVLGGALTAWGIRTGNTTITK